MQNEKDQNCYYWAPWRLCPRFKHIADQTFFCSCLMALFFIFSFQITFTLGWLRRNNRGSMSNVISFNSHAKLGSVIGEASISKPNIFRYRELVFDVVIFLLFFCIYPTPSLCSSHFSFVTVSVANKPHGLYIQILCFYSYIRSKMRRKREHDIVTKTTNSQAKKKPLPASN